MKFLKYFILFVIVILVILLFIALKADDKDLCLDTGYCKEGLIINTRFGKIIVNQANCINSNGKWIQNKKYCKF